MITVGLGEILLVDKIVDKSLLATIIHFNENLTGDTIAIMLASTAIFLIFILQTSIVKILSRKIEKSKPDGEALLASITHPTPEFFWLIMAYIFVLSLGLKGGIYFALPFVILFLLSLLPEKVEVYKNGIKVGMHFWEWKEVAKYKWEDGKLKIYFETEQVIIRDKKEEIKRIVEKYVNDE